jgi:hypothetical protein
LLTYYDKRTQKTRGFQLNFLILCPTLRCFFSNLL